MPMAIAKSIRKNAFTLNAYDKDGILSPAYLQLQGVLPVKFRQSCIPVTKIEIFYPPGGYFVHRADSVGQKYFRNYELTSPNFEKYALMSSSLTAGSNLPTNILFAFALGFAFFGSIFLPWSLCSDSISACKKRTSK